MILNQELGFDQVRWAIAHSAHERTSYDTKKSFLGIPVKQRLEPPAKLFRLDYIAAGRQFLEVWWMREPVFQSLVAQAHRDPAMFRQNAEAGHALPPVTSKPLKNPKGPIEVFDRLSATEIQLTQPVYAWVGIASKLFDKPGGLEQVFLPNLHERGNPGFSDHARIVRTYWILSEAGNVTH